MGYLHEGHLSLIRQSKQKCDVTVVSIFVNPTQFGPSEDFNSYPRDVDKDSELLEKEGVDFLFLPSNEKIYHQNFQTYVNVELITKNLEGEFRPTHFRGVTTIVLILFNCVQPDYAFFGQKDAQQLIVLKQMVKDLKVNVEIVMCPIKRESDGLAMSSRNVYLSKQERSDATILYRSLQEANKMIDSRERKVNLILSEMTSLYTSISSAQLDYVKIVEANTFELVDELTEGKEYFVLVACKIGKTRLIDNILITT